MIDGLNIPRILDLGNVDDRTALREAASGISGLLSSIDEHLDEYLAMFPETWWRTVYSGGMIVVSESPEHRHGFDVGQM